MIVMTCQGKTPLTQTSSENFRLIPKYHYYNKQAHVKQTFKEGLTLATTGVSHMYFELKFHLPPQ